MASDDLTLTIAGRSISGWTSTKVTRGIERMPNSFALTLTDIAPGDAQGLSVQPGDPCQVMIGSDLVITGYVNRFIPKVDAKMHSIEVSGRSKSQDLVDCSAEWPGGQITGSSALQIAQKLAMPYGITVNGLVDTGAPIPQFNLTLTETAYAIIERIARYRALLFYDMPDGSTVLAQAGSTAMASGLVLGGPTANCLRAAATYSDDERYSTYVAFIQSMETLEDTGQGGNLLATITDPIPKRHRQKDIISEGGGQGNDVAIKRANWEAARRAGRSWRIEATADSWRDSAGTLWTPNNTIPLSLSALKLPSATYVIGEVTYIKDEEGTTAEMVIMPQPAFLPEPILLQPDWSDVGAQP